MKEAKTASGLPLAAEIAESSQIDLFDGVDMLIVGGRNMRNYELLRALGKSSKPVLLKRAVSATYEELLMSAEYIMSSGNPNVVLCERGIRTFEPHTAFTMDISAAPVLKTLSHLPVMFDPSNASGKYDLVEPLALAAVAAGADGIIVTVHADPAHAMCDGPLSVKPDRFRGICEKIKTIKGQ